MRNIIKTSFCLLLVILLSSCGETEVAANIPTERKDLYAETVGEHQKTVFIAKNNDTDLTVDFDKILDVKNRSTLHSIVLSNEISEICDDAFEYCTQLEWIDVSHSVKTIGSNAFYKCTSLQTVVIENQEIKISSNAFEDCFALQTIYFFGSINEWKLASEKCNGCLDNVEIICCESADKMNVCFQVKE